MVKKITTYLLCFTLAWSTVFPVTAAEKYLTRDMTEQDIRQQYPHAKIIHIEAENYPLLAESLREQGYIKDSETRLDSADKAIEQSADEKAVSTSSDCGAKTGAGTSSSDATFQGAIDISDSLFRSSGNSGGGNEGAVIVFVIIGAILIVVWALYVFKYLYDLSTGFKPCETWYEFAFASSSITSNSDQSIDLDGLRFTTGFRDGNTDVGIAVELGHSDILLTEVSSLKLDGFYWLLGPVLRWRLSGGKNPHYFHMNFMGGSTEHDETGVIARATLGLRFGLGENFHLGVSWGAMNINLNNDQGIITERDQYHYLYGINTGFRF